MASDIADRIIAACKVNLPQKQASEVFEWGEVIRQLPQLAEQANNSASYWRILAIVLHRFSSDECIGTLDSSEGVDEILVMEIDAEASLAIHLHDVEIERFPLSDASLNPIVQFIYSANNEALSKISVDHPSLVLQIVLNANFRNVHFRFRRDVLSSNIAEHMANAFVHICNSTDPCANIAVKHLPLWESSLDLTQFAPKLAPHEGSVRLLADFEDQVRRHPDAVALIFEGETLTYKEFNSRANRLGQALRRRGVKPDDVVALCAERSLEMMIALYGIVKSGAAYMPIEVELPKDRVRFMLDDAKPRVLLVHSHQALAAKDFGVELLLVDRDVSCARDEVGKDFDPETGPYHLAYVLFTSGSTGKPKGVCYPIIGCMNRIQWMQKTYQLGPKDRLLQKTPYGFDVSFWEFFWPLSVGARIVICKPHGHSDTQYLAKTIATHAISIIHFVPSMLNLFLNDAPLDRCPSLRWIISSGEALTPRLEALCAHYLSGTLHNQYGPTESGECSFWESTAKAQYRSVPIGEALPGFRMAVLDTGLQKLPMGAVGELYIAGSSCLARNYLNRPQLTAERFLPDVLTGESGGRMYKTGDLAREIAPGLFEYLGRMDHQVKVRGFRIDIGEIEGQLELHAGVREARVFALEFGEFDKRLVAYVIPEGHSDALEDSLRQWLRNSLPAYMEPSAFVMLERFPVTTNGKFNMKALPKPGSLSFVSSQDFSTDLQSILAELWAETLGTLPVGLDQDFFQAGGDSLRAIRFVQSIRETFELDVSMLEFHDARSVRALEALLIVLLGRI